MSWKISFETSEISWMSEYSCVGIMGLDLLKSNINFQTSQLRYVRAIRLRMKRLIGQKHLDKYYEHCLNLTMSDRYTAELLRPF